MKKRATLLVLIALTTFAILAISRGPRFMASPTPQTSFTATLVERRFSPTGVQIYEEQLIRAVGTTGTVEIIRRLDPLGHWVEMKSIVDFRRQERIVIDPITESRTTYLKVGNRYPFREALQTSDCSGDPTVETDVIAGYRVMRVLKPWRPDEPESKWERWFAPELGCFALKETITHSGGTPSTTREVIFVLRGEPPSSLFEVPSNYTERSPSEVLAEFARRFGKRAPDFERTGEVLDRSYYQFRR
jgi:hypothetical protein